MSPNVLLSGITLKFVLLISSIIQLGILVRNFSEAQVALFFISLGVYSIINLAEIGAGTSIVSLSQLDPANSITYLQRGLQIYLRFISVFVMVGIIFFITPFFISIERKWLHGLPNSDRHGSNLLLILFLLILLRVSASLVHRVCWANGRGFFSNLVQILTSILLTISMYFYATSTQLPSLQTLILIYYCIPIAFDAIMIFGFLKIIDFNFIKERNHMDWKKQFRDSVRFLGVAAIGVVAFKLDGTMVALLLTAKHVILITVVWRVYSVVPNLLDFLSKPFWSKFSEAIRLKDRIQARESLSRYYKIVLWLSLISCIPIYIFINDILLLLDKSSFKNGNVPMLLNISSFLLAVSMAVSGPTSMYLNAAMLGKDLFKVSVILTLLNLSLSVIFTYFLGVAGPILGSAISLGIFGIIANHKIAMRHINQI